MNTIWSLSMDAEKHVNTRTICGARINIAAILPYTDTEREGGERVKEGGGGSEVEREGGRGKETCSDI